jgi:hypothetical protein
MHTHTHTHTYTKACFLHPTTLFSSFHFKKEAFSWFSCYGFIWFVSYSCFVLTRLQVILLCKRSHPCDDNNASNTFWLMMTHGDGSCVVVVVLVSSSSSSSSGAQIFWKWYTLTLTLTLTLEKSWEQVEKFHNKELTRVDAYLGRYIIITRVQDLFGTTLLAPLKQSWNLTSPSIAYHDTTTLTTTSLPWQLWH